MNIETFHWFSGETGKAKIRKGDLMSWIEDHGGAVIVYPPKITNEGKWLIAVTDKTNRFNQR